MLIQVLPSQRHYPFKVFWFSPLLSQYIDLGAPCRVTDGDQPGCLKFIHIWELKGIIFLSFWFSCCSSYMFWPGGPLLSSNAALQMATSLGRLQASSVDLVYLHSPDPTTHIADTMRVMDALHRTVRGSRLLALIQENYIEENHSAASAANPDHHWFVENANIFQWLEPVCFLPFRKRKENRKTLK